jgi:hypothetical protein
MHQLVKHLQEQLKKLTSKTNGKHEEKENQQNGNTNQNLMDHPSPLIVNGGEKSQSVSNERNLSPELRGGEGGKKQAEAIKKMSELAARNPLYTSLHRWESTLHFAS